MIMMQRQSIRRLFMIVLAVSLALGFALSTIGQRMASADDGAVIVDDHFDDLATGSFPEGWVNSDTGPEEEHAPDEVVAFPSAEDKSLKFTKYNVTGLNKITKSIDGATGVITVSFDLYIEQDDSPFLQFNALGDGGSRGLTAVFRDAGLTVHNSGFKVIHTGLNYDGWHRLKFVLDSDRELYDVYINGMIVLNKGEYRDDAVADFSAISTLEFHTAGATFGALTSYINNFKVEHKGAILEEHYGAEMGPEILGQPTGGGEGYTDVIDPSEADFLVSTKDELLDALGQAAAGQVVYVADDAVIDLTDMGVNPVNIPGGVTLASGRGSKLGDGSISQGALIFTDFMKDAAPDTASGFENRMKAFWIEGMLKTTGPDARITGLRLQGNHMTTGMEHEGFTTYMLPVSTGILSRDWVTVDNNEIYGWSFAGVRTGNGFIHHNDIHHTQRTGLGYNISLDNLPNDGRGVIVEGNKLYQFRHAIAATGEPYESYEARYNWVGTGIGFAFDMHAQLESTAQAATHGDKGGVYMAGDTIKIHHNTFTDLANRSITIRGVPVTGAFIDYNWFQRPLEDGYVVIQQRNSYGNLFVGKNVYGMEKVLFDGYMKPADPEFSVPAVTVTDMTGAAVQQLAANQYINVNVEVTNNHYQRYQSSIIAVLKNEAGAVVRMGVVNRNFEQKSRESASIGFQLPESVSGHYIEVFLWDSLQGMRATTPTITLFNP